MVLAVVLAMALGVREALLVVAAVVFVALARFALERRPVGGTVTRLTTEAGGPGG